MTNTIERANAMNGTHGVGAQQLLRAPQRDTGAVARAGRDFNLETAPVRLLDTYAPGGVLEVAAPRLDALATISAGFRAPGVNGRAGLPQRSTDGTIYLHDPEGRAPGLAQALLANDKKRLTIALPSDDLRRCVQQYFAAYSTTKLLAQGDETGITEIRGEGDNAQRIWHPAGSEGFAAMLKKCKVCVSLYFYLAEWGPDGPEIVMPDGVGYYRLRFTSRNSLRGIVDYLSQNIMPYTGGRIAGLPLDLSISNRDVAAPDGSRRRVPVWQLRLKPPSTVRLTARTWRDIAQAGLAQAGVMVLPSPDAGLLALEEGEVLDMDEAGTSFEDSIYGAPRCDVAFWERKWFAAVRGTVLESDEARADFIGRFTAGATDSLAVFLQTASDEIAQELFNAAMKVIGDAVEAAANEADERQAAHYESASDAPVCYCGLAARYIRGKSGEGYVCGNYGTKAPMCEFRQRAIADDLTHAEDLASGAADGVNLADGIPIGNAPQENAPDLALVADTVLPAAKRGDRGQRYPIPEGFPSTPCQKCGSITYVLDGPNGGVRIVDPDGYRHQYTCSALGQAVPVAQAPVAQAHAPSPVPASAAAVSRPAPQTPLSQLMLDAASYGWAHDEGGSGPNLHRLRQALTTAGITAVAFDNLPACRAALHAHYKTQPAPDEAAPEASAAVEAAA